MKALIRKVNRNDHDDVSQIGKKCPIRPTEEKQKSQD